MSRVRKSIVDVILFAGSSEASLYIYELKFVHSCQITEGSTSCIDMWACSVACFHGTLFLGPYSSSLWPGTTPALPSSVLWGSCFSICIFIRADTLRCLPFSRGNSFGQIACNCNMVKPRCSIKPDLSHLHVSNFTPNFQKLMNDVQENRNVPNLHFQKSLELSC